MTTDDRPPRFPPTLDAAALDGGRLRFDDSEIAAIEADGDMLAIRFAAAVVEAADGRGIGHATGCRVLLHGARIEDRREPCFGRIVRGRLQRAGHAVASTLALRSGEHPEPPATPGPLRLELQLAHGAGLVVQAAGASAVAGPGARFHESLQC